MSCYVAVCFIGWFLRRTNYVKSERKLGGQSNMYNCINMFISQSSWAHFPDKVRQSEGWAGLGTDAFRVLCIPGRAVGKLQPTAWALAPCGRLSPSGTGWRVTWRPSWDAWSAAGPRGRTLINWSPGLVGLGSVGRRARLEKYVAKKCEEIDDVGIFRPSITMCPGWSGRLPGFRPVAA